MNLRKEVITFFHLVLLGRELAADTFYHILKLLRKIDREIKMLRSEKLLEENQSQLFRIEEMLEVYSDLRSSHQEKCSSSRKRAAA